MLGDGSYIKPKVLKVKYNSTPVYDEEDSGAPNWLYLFDLGFDFNAKFF